MKILISLLLSFVFAVTLFAQREDVTVETDLPTTLLRAEELPLPDYPEIAKNAGLRGRVSVDIILDDEGRVVTVENPRGPYPVCQSVTDPPVMALRNSAVAAAEKARFQRVDGQAIPGKGRITYTFESNVRAVELPVSKGGRDRMTVIGTMDNSSKSKTVSAHTLNGKAAEVPRPVYPAAARAVRAAGSVNVQVLITEDGTVYSAKTVSGHPLLRSSSEMAACSARFLPTLLGGHPVKVSGIITYNFVP